MARRGSEAWLSYYHWSMLCPLFAISGLILVADQGPYFVCSVLGRPANLAQEQLWYSYSVMPAMILNKAGSLSGSVVPPHAASMRLTVQHGQLSVDCGSVESGCSNV